MSTTHPELLSALRSASRLLGRRLELSVARTEDDCTVASQVAAIRSDQPLGAEERAFLRDFLSLVERQLLIAKSFSLFESRVEALERENAELLMKNLALNECSQRDGLTGLFTRAYAIEKIEEEMNRAWRHGDPMSLLMIDIDHLKRINESHGTAAGDEVLRSAGHIVRSNCRIYDVPARFAGEQFCLLLPSTPLGRTRAVAERIRHRIHSHRVRVNQLEVAISCSIGIAGLDNVPEAAIFNTDSLIDRAGRALFLAKDRGRNRVEAWSPALTQARSAPGAEH